MRLPHFDYAAPTTVAEALRLLAEKGPGARVLAGGTDLIIRMRHGLVKPSAIIHLGGIAALRVITYKPKTGLVHRGRGHAGRGGGPSRHPAALSGRGLCGR